MAIFFQLIVSLLLLLLLFFLRVKHNNLGLSNFLIFVSVDYCSGLLNRVFFYVLNRIILINAIIPTDNTTTLIFSTVNNVVVIIHVTAVAAIDNIFINAVSWELFIYYVTV